MTKAQNALRDVKLESPLRRAPVFGASGLAAAAAFPALHTNSAAAHHGWKTFDTRYAFYVSGSVVRVHWGYPHTEARLRIERTDLPANWEERELPPGATENYGKLTMASARPYRGPQSELDLLLADPRTMERWGFDRALRIGEWLEAVGFLATPEGRDIRPVMFWVAGGQGVWQQLTSFPQLPEPASR